MHSEPSVCLDSTPDSQNRLFQLPVTLGTWEFDARFSLPPLSILPSLFSMGIIHSFIHSFVYFVCGLHALKKKC